MGLARSILDKLAVRVLGRNEYESEALRAYFRKHYDIQVGKYSIGAFDRWRIPPGSRIGRYCSIAKSARLLDANHPIDAISSHPYFYLKKFELVSEDRAQIRPPIIEDDVWLGHNCTIAPSCNRIGRGAVIGAGAVVMNDVPPYAVMVGAPAKLVRYRFSSDTIAAIEATRWWTLDREELQAALKSSPTLALRPSPEAAEQFLIARGEVPPKAVKRAPDKTPSNARASAAHPQLMGLLTAEIPEFGSDDFYRDFQELDIDSFGLINLRIGLEKLRGGPISDRMWSDVERPADLLAFLDNAPLPTEGNNLVPVPMEPVLATPTEGPSKTGAGEKRLQEINMPQMALSGLSEAWTFKEIGDLHWSVLTRGLGTNSAAIQDSEGDRLYATFTRICLTSSVPLTSFRENDQLTVALEMERYGAGMFFSRVTMSGAAAHASAEVMTTFSKFGEAGANTSLLKGQPTIPDACEIPLLQELPAFAQAYRARRAEPVGEVIFETEYAILPPHDINGVGLLYFAAYPIITDICAMRFGPPAMLEKYSTKFRDVYYFANSTSDDILIFRVHRWELEDAELRFESSISRKSDGKLMAYVITTKQRVG